MDRVANELIVPSCARGTEALRLMIFGARLSNKNMSWVLELGELGQPWATIATQELKSVVVDDHVVEWLLEDGFARQIDIGRQVSPTPRGRQFIDAIDRQVMTVDRQYLVRGDDLRGTAAVIKRLFPEHDNFVRAQMVAQAMLCTLLGEEWFEDHVVSSSPPTPFFRNAADDDHSISVGGLRRIQLAEMLWNLRHVGGMDNTLRLLYSGKVPDAFAELEVGKILTVFGKSFRVIDPRGQLGSDYDLEIDFNGTTVCADTKCKLETTEMSERSIENSLDQGRKQLPKDRPSILFVCLPQRWHDASGQEFGKLLQRVALRFLRNTQRVVSVKFHASLIVEANGNVFPQTSLLEVPNVSHRFEKGLEDNLYFDQSELPSSWVSILRECSDET